MGVAARELAKAGYVAFSIDYRLLDTVTAQNPWPAQLDDAQRAVRWVRAHADTYGVDPKRLAAYGWSAGGHLAAVLGVRDTRDNSDPGLAAYSSRVDCVISLGGDMDLSVPQADDEYRPFLAAFLGGTAEEQPEAYQDASPLTWVDATAAYFLIVHGGDDDAILADQSRRMVTALYEAGVRVAMSRCPTSAIAALAHGTSLVRSRSPSWGCGSTLSAEVAGGTPAALGATRVLKPVR